MPHFRKTSLKLEAPRAAQEMEAPSEQDMEALIRDLEALEKEYNDVKCEIACLKTSLGVETQKREAAESLCARLEADKQRLLKSQEERLNNTIQQLDFRSKYQTLWQEVKLSKDQHGAQEKEYEQVIATLKEQHEIALSAYEKKIRQLQSQLSFKEENVSRLEQEVAQLHVAADILKQDAEQRAHDDHLKYIYETESLKQKLKDETESTQKLQKEFERQEQSALTERTRLEGLLRELSSNRHVGALKQKVMKLRKENEDLKHQLLRSGH